MDKLAKRKILKQFSDGKISWRAAAGQLELDDFSMLIALLHEYNLPFPTFSEEAAKKWLPPSANS